MTRMEIPANEVVPRGEYIRLMGDLIADRDRQTSSMLCWLTDRHRLGWL